MAKKKVKKATTKKAAAKKAATKTPKKTTASTKKKAATKKTPKKKATRKKKTASVVRKRLVWGVFSASMKEEGRYPYDHKKEADKKLAQLQAKSKKPYFIQPIKEVLADVPKSADEEDPPKKKA